MLNYLKQFNITEEEIHYLKQTLSDEEVENLEVMRLNVTETLNLFHQEGVTNIIGILKERPDLCYKDINQLKEKLNKLDKNLLIYIINNSIDDLSNFNI